MFQISWLTHQVVDPEVDGEWDCGDAPLEDHHGLLLGAAVPLLVVGVLLPVAVAVRVPVQEGVVRLARLRVRRLRRSRVDVLNSARSTITR